MALTLPYPDMVFVPLDILTAEEQNQLVGNIEFLANQFPLTASNIANGAIGSDQLADEAVTTDKIDFTTFKFPTPDYSNGTTISSSTNTWTAPNPGIVASTLVADTSVGYKTATVSVNGKVVASSLWAGAVGGYNFQTRAVVPVGTGDVVTFSATDGQSKVDQRVFFPYKWV